MAWTNKPLWFEGMFVRPQHFQQHDRFLEAFVEARTGGIRPFAWGVQEYRFDPNQLALGKVSLMRFRGVMPDGTPVDVPEADDAPPVRDVPQAAYGQRLHLAIPLRRPSGVEVDGGDGAGFVARYRAVDLETRDTASRSDTPAGIRIGKLNCRLLLDSEPREEYVCLPLARIKEVQESGAIVLHEAFLPPALDCAADSRFGGLLKEVAGLLRQRGESLAGRVDLARGGGVSGVADFLMLQLVNRHEPLFAHYAELPGLHPEEVYRALLMLAGDLSAFASSRRRPGTYPAYRHDDLENVLGPVMAEIRQALSMVIEQGAIAIPLQKRKYGVYVAPMPDRSLLGTAQFVFAVSAEISSEVLRQRFPTQVKTGPVEDIRDLVNLQLPGIALRPLPVAPRQIPYHRGAVYFELDQRNELWRKLQSSAGFAFHVSGEYPGLELEFWAVREERA